MTGRKMYAFGQLCASASWPKAFVSAQSMMDIENGIASLQKRINFLFVRSLYICPFMGTGLLHSFWCISPTGRPLFYDRCASLCPSKHHLWFCAFLVVGVKHHHGVVSWHWYLQRFWKRFLTAFKVFHLSFTLWFWSFSINMPIYLCARPGIFSQHWNGP